MQTDVSLSDANAKRDHTLRDVLIVLAVGSVLVFPSFFTRDPWNPDEPRYVEVAREMVVLNDYVTPRLNGVLYPDKPPLFFWLASVFYRIGFGMNSGRFVAALANLGTLLLVYFFGCRLLPAPGGLLAAVVTATTFLFFGLLKPGVIDPLLTFLTTVALVAAYHALRGGPRRVTWWLLFYGACSLGILAKGPVGIIVPAIVGVVYAAFHRKAVSAGGWAHAAGAVVVLAIVGTWVAGVWHHAGAEYTKEVVLNKAASYTTEHTSHAHGPHYYFAMLPLYVFPWTFFAALALAQAFVAWRKRKDGDAAFLFLWVACILVFFSAITAKRERYLLPLIPAVGLLCARYFVLGMRDGVPWPKLHRWFSVVTFGSIGLLAVAIAAVPWLVHPWLEKSFADAPDVAVKLRAVTSPVTIVLVTVAALVLLGAAVAGIRSAVRNASPWAPVLVVLAAMIIVSLCFDLLAFPLLNPVKSGRAFAVEALPYLKKAHKSYMYGDEYSGVINLYTGIVSIPAIDGADKAERMLAILQREAPSRIAVVTDLGSFKSIRDRLPQGFHVAVQQQIGHRSMLLFCNWPVPNAQPPAP